ncbi:MAG: lytic murein transglycosylase B [Burkholderiaceae bacterium]|nr:lytic murein transglycosylase B [Burkholderiaceae bacterium]
MGNSNVTGAALVVGALLLAVVPAAVQAQSPRSGSPAATDAASPARPALSTQSYATRPEAQAFIDRMVQAHGFDRAALQALFARLKPSERVVHLMTPTTGGTFRRSWREYRARFVQPARIDGGLAFWQDNGADLRLASALHGVPEEIIVAIIGVETLYGRNTGKFPVAESLATLAFDYPSRADYFRSELEQYLLYARENAIDPLEPLGSYAGAIGTPQFMPGSIRRFAVDHDKDGRIDLRNSNADAIGSVAHFLARHGWIAGKPTHYPVMIADLAKARPFIDAGPVPQSSILALAEAGVTSSVEIPSDEKLVLVDLVNADGPADHVLGTQNFYAITRYNRSYFYAMAVIDLAAELRRRRAGEAPPQ